MGNEPHGNIYVIILTILGTIVIMIVSAMFTISNIKRVWWLGSVKKKRAAAAAAANRENNEKKEQQNNVKNEKKEDTRRSQVDKEECVAAATKNNGTKSSSCQEPSECAEVREPPDPVQYYHHIPSEVKKARQRVAIKNIKSQLTDEELEEEKAIQKKQLQEMFDLMKSQGDKFGLSDSEMQKQMQLYSI